MAKFQKGKHFGAPAKKSLTPFSPGGSVTSHVGKGATEQPLEGGAMSTLAPGDPASRSMNDYAKATPMAQPPAGPMGGGANGDSGGNYGGGM
jgi:hypothetical protein